MLIFVSFIFKMFESAPKNSSPETSVQAADSSQLEEENKQTETENVFSDLPNVQLPESKEKDNKKPVDCSSIKEFFKTLPSEHAEEFARWSEERGYWKMTGVPSNDGIYNYDFGDYSTYDEETILELAKQGDGKANMILATLHRQKIITEPIDVKNKSASIKRQNKII